MAQRAVPAASVAPQGPADLMALVPIFANMPPSLLAALAEKLHAVRVRSGKAIFHAEDPATALYVIIRGAVKVFIPSADGREVVLAVLRTGDVLGEMSLLDNARRSASALALDDTELVSLNRQDFDAVLNRHPAAARAILSVLAQRLRRTNQAIQDAYLLDVPGRLARRLLVLADEHGIETAEGTEIGLRVSQQDLASMIGASRVAVNKQLQVWRHQGIVAVQRQRITVLDADRLAREFGQTP